MNLVNQFILFVMLNLSTIVPNQLLKKNMEKITIERLSSFKIKSSVATILMST